MLKRADFHGEKKLDKEDNAEWVLVFQLVISSNIERDRWMRIETERRD
jgi:hypothetical protein